MSRFDFERLSLIFVDDSTPMHAIMRTLLAAMRIKNVTFCETGEQALGAMRICPPDIVITDWVMEPMSGYEFVRWVRTDESSPNPYTPIIMVTAYSAESEIVKARDAGVTEILTKPLSVETLHNRIEMIIDRPRPFVRTREYFGPDRRRADRPFQGEDRRRGDEHPDSAIGAS